MPKPPAPAAEISLKDYVAQNKPHRCWVCRSPRRAEMDAIYREHGRDSIAPMVRWLQKAGEDVTDSKLRHHFVTYRHHEKED